MKRICMASVCLVETYWFLEKKEILLYSLQMMGNSYLATWSDRQKMEVFIVKNVGIST
jgi:hypothetical protein